MDNAAAAGFNGDPRTTRATRDLLTSVDLNLLRTFLAVYRHGSFTAAVAELGLSQPTITRQVRALEQDIERELFIRHPRGIEPTPPAHELAARVAAPLDALAAVGTPATTMSPVYLAGPSELLCVRVLPALAPLVMEGVQLRISQGLPASLIQEMRTGRHDLVIATHRPRGSGMEAAVLADEEYLLVASPALAERVRQHARTSDLCTVLNVLPLIAYAEDLPIIRRYWRTIFATRHTPRAAVTVPNLYAVLSAVTAGAGYSVLPRSLCRDHLDSGRLVVLHDPEVPPLNTLFLLQRPGADVNPDVLRVRRQLQHAARKW